GNMPARARLPHKPAAPDAAARAGAIARDFLAPSFRGDAQHRTMGTLVPLRISRFSGAQVRSIAHASRAPERQRERSPFLVRPVNLREGLRDPALAALG